MLFLNEGGVLIDRTAEFASSAINLPKGVTDSGFLTPTNDRGVTLADVNGDGWLDIITATTLSDGQPKHIGHPRVYINLGDDELGAWRGFVFDNARIPQMLTSSLGLGGVPQTPTSGFNPRFNAVAAGDLTGDGFPELLFVDHDSTGGGGVFEPPGMDFNNKLLLNDGTGHFTDVTTAALTGTLTVGTSTRPIWFSSFGCAAAIADMNGDAANDLIWQSGDTQPQCVAIAYNDSANPGGFRGQAQVVFPSTVAPYFMSVADMNNDGRLDVVETDANTDRYRLATGVTGGVTGWTGDLLIPNSPSGGFGGQNHPADLDRDGWMDIVISDVDIDIEGCGRTANIVRNNANPPNVTFSVSTGGIPNSMLTGVHDFAVLDINNDGWLDLVIGRCSGTQVWIFDAPAIPGDLSGDGIVNTIDLGILLSAWSIPAGAPGCGGALPCAADLNGDGHVNALDLGILLSAWTL